MAQFPLSEAEILALGQEVIAGLAAHPAIYPAPPVSIVDLQADLAALVSARDAVVAARAAAEQATATKTEARKSLVAYLKSVIRYAENTVDFDDDQLKLIGWAGRHTRVPLQPPGQPRELEAPKEGEGWIRLNWKEPDDGGVVAAYKVQRRARSSARQMSTSARPSSQAGAHTVPRHGIRRSSWLDIGTALESEIKLTHQERGKEWEYRIIAINKAGESESSNTVMAVL